MGNDRRTGPAERGAYLTSVSSFGPRTAGPFRPDYGPNSSRLPLFRPEYSERSGSKRNIGPAFGNTSGPN
ncbi:Hypothetical protein NTJ_03340 [Nesidiocoris tenuis]|nr:Hypothetical protein NTJ_03340 [Nesidiocoris tenuis]